MLKTIFAVMTLALARSMVKRSCSRNCARSATPAPRATRPERPWKVVAAPLYSSEHCAEQSYAIGNTVATVAHPEVTSGMLQEWLRIYGCDIQANSTSVQSIEQIQERLSERCDAMHRVFTDRLYDVWIARVQAYRRHASAA